MTSVEFTVGLSHWTVPVGVKQVMIDCYGATGDGHGKGGRASALFDVTPGEILDVYTGGAPSGPNGGFNGGGNGGQAAGSDAGGGGGGSDVRRAGVKLLVAGGGGGFAATELATVGGSGGYPNGEDGHPPNAYIGFGYEGRGGTQSAGGAAGAPGALGQTGTPGTLGRGGDGGSFGTLRFAGGGGGGGYYGGGAACEWAGGGGGSSAVLDPTATHVHYENGVQSGDGLVVITYSVICFDPFNVVAPYSSETNLYSGEVAVSTTGKYRAAVQSIQPYFDSSTPGTYTWTVPAGVTSVRVECSGAAGGPAGLTRGGKGGRVNAVLTVVPGETLQINVGGTDPGNSAGGYNGGGGASGWTAGGYPGGGASDIRRSPSGLGNRLIVAAGGGGAGGQSFGGGSPANRGGDGGYPAGGNGLDFNGDPTGAAGNGASQVAGGTGGALTSGTGVAGSNGALGVGGACGRGGSTALGVAAGGGGGGLYGGGGAEGNESNVTSGGGGGSSGVPDLTATAVSYTNGVQTGDGRVRLTAGATHTVYRSGDGGATFQQFEAPDQTYGGLQSNFVVAVDDDGTLHLARLTEVGGDIFRYWKYQGSWTAGNSIATGISGGNNNTSPHYIGSNGTTLVAMLGQNPSTNLTYRSIDGGVTWVAATGSAPVARLHPKTHVVWIGPYIHHIVYYDLAPIYQYRRYNPTTNVWEAPSTPASFPVIGIGAGLPRLFSRTGSTTELYAAFLQTGDTLYLYRSTDRGMTWSTVCANETIGSSWSSTLSVFLNSGLSMGADGDLHIWGQTIDGKFRVKTVSRNLSASGVYSALQDVGVPPNGGRKNTGTPNYNHYPVQRADGWHERTYDLWGQWFLQSSAAAPTELLLISCVGRRGGWSINAYRW